MVCYNPILMYPVEGAIAKNGDSYIFTVHGYGHGAGMSQYGASFLAEQGKNYHEILRHYYTGISFSILE